MFKQDNFLVNSIVLGSLIIICLFLSLWQFEKEGYSIKFEIVIVK